MDRCISLIILLAVSGCVCLTDKEDSNSVPEYFEGCWNKLNGNYSTEDVEKVDRRNDKKPW